MSLDYIEKVDRTRLYFLVAILGILLIIWAVYFNSINAIKKEAGFSLADQKKAEILKQVAATDKKPMTEAQKQELFLLLKGDRVNRYNFTQAESDKIIKALNR